MIDQYRQAYRGLKEAIEGPILRDIRRITWFASQDWDHTPRPPSQKELLPEFRKHYPVPIYWARKLRFETTESPVKVRCLGETGEVLVIDPTARMELEDRLALWGAALRFLYGPADTIEIDLDSIPDDPNSP